MALVLNRIWNYCHMTRHPVIFVSLLMTFSTLNIFVSLSLTFADKGRMGNFPINQKNQRGWFFWLYNCLVFFAIYLICHSFTPAMPEINQIIFLISQIFHGKIFHWQTDQHMLLEKLKNLKPYFNGNNQES